MGNTLRYIGYFLKNAPSTIWCRLRHKAKRRDSFLGTKNINIESSGKLLEELIEKGEPFCAIRFGAVELGALNNHERILCRLSKTYKEPVRKSMKLNAGFYPTNDRHLNEYAELFGKRAKNIDVLAVSGLHMEDYFAKKYCPKAKYITNWAMEPLLGKWTKALKGKKVLVISGFGDDIALQYSRRHLLFPNEPDILPEFKELLTLSVPQTNGDVMEFKFQSSLRVLEELENQIAKLDFDIALIGAGVYGSLLAMYIKSIGKMAIQSGGATQTLFGIIGHRWENREHVASRINENWIRPSHRPEGYDKIDNGAYW